MALNASDHIKFEGEENICLFCNQPVEYGWVTRYKGTNVWICRKCVMRGELGAVMATAVMDQGHNTLEELNRTLETTQMKLYRDVLHTFPVGGEEAKTEAESKEPEPKEEEEESSDLGELEDKARPEEETIKANRLDEEQLLNCLDDWRSIRDIQQHTRLGYKALLEKLDDMYRRGKIDKERVKIETGGRKYKYKRI